MYSSELESFERALREVALVGDAPAMKAYMKGHFEFIGVKSQVRKTVSQDFIREQVGSGELDKAMIQALWDSPYREMQYVAMDILARSKRYWEPEHLHFFKKLIQEKSWWDTVDFLASTCVGGVIKKYPTLESQMDDWNASGDMWLVRTSIIYQLKYKEEVDTLRLSRFILPHTESKEFFIQKAIGWALRQYAKYNPDWVQEFVSEHPMATLSRREALKHIA